MIEHFKSQILAASGAVEIKGYQVIQSLWSGYGEIVRLQLAGGPHPTLIAKAISLPDNVAHPRGWNTNTSHQRKIHSYEVEMQWYCHWYQQCDDLCRVARSYLVEGDEQQSLILLEDLDAAGFSLRYSQLDLQGIKRCLRWLAHFHACFMGVEPDGLWSTGSYWHLDTRPDELVAMADGPLKQYAAEIDHKLSNARYQTVIHGDAKVANFCFACEGEEVAAVDFQYVGRGCGIRDVAYLMGSCLSSDECQQWQEGILEYYFAELAASLDQQAFDVVALEAEWRALYPFAWADFERFLLGWMPSHHKLNQYSGQQVSEVLNQLTTK